MDEKLEKLLTVKNVFGTNVLSKYKLAKVLNVSRNTVVMWCKGIYKPSRENLKKIHNLYKTLKFLFMLAVAVIAGGRAWADEIDWTKLTEAVIEVESGGREDAVSDSGAVGLMQITPICLKEYQQIKDGETIQGLTMNDMFNTVYNKEVGVRYLLLLHTRYGCKTVEQICAGYNCGPTKLRSVDYDISKCPRETQSYVKKVMKIYKEVK